MNDASSAFSNDRLWRKISSRDLVTRNFWIGDYDYRALLSFRSRKLPFFAPNSPLPAVLALILGLQHCLAMVVPPLLLGGAAGAALEPAQQSYLVSAALIFCGLGTILQVSRIPLARGYYLGSGVLNTCGTSFAFVSSALAFINNQYGREGGICSLAADGSKLPCPAAYGAVIGTASVVGPIPVLLSFTPPKVLRKIFTPLVTGSILLMIGLSLMGSGMTNWAGGSSCQSGGLCPNVSAPHAAPWGSPRLIGLGFLVWISILIIDIFGPPIAKNMSAMLGLIIGMIVAGAIGYFDKSYFSSAPVVTFLWVHRFPLSVRGELVLPFIASYLVVISEGIGNITATCAASGYPVKGPRYASHVQGGLTSDALLSCLSGLATVPPSTTFSQNVSIVSLSQNASRISGYVCGTLLIAFGLFGKVAAVWVALPAPLIGGLTVFLFASVAVAGLRILAGLNWTRRTRFIATAALSLGFADITTPGWFSNFFTYAGPNHALRGFLDALTLIVEESYLITLLLAVPLQFIVPLGEDDLEYKRAEDEEDVLGCKTSKSRLEYEVERVPHGDEEMALEAVDRK
ncbi:membrane transporter, nucleobase:cation symporter-2 [Rhodotorula toruloides]|uniref:Membrane transporter, nucleobase:cation symporter-2 n=1 Tax=Rhodotorula toruloides TaxID=5286 RepID=A0A511KQB9_RHOTO|nr:membrane transporter, nucleobase:cation symporter-2 [Rhodotorula toruloides]